MGSKSCKAYERTPSTIRAEEAVIAPALLQQAQEQSRQKRKSGVLVANTDFDVKDADKTIIHKGDSCTLIKREVNFIEVFVHNKDQMVWIGRKEWPNIGYYGVAPKRTGAKPSGCPNPNQQIRVPRSKMRQNAVPAEPTSPDFATSPNMGRVAFAPTEAGDSADESSGEESTDGPKEEYEVVKQFDTLGKPAETLEEGQTISVISKEEKLWLVRSDEFELDQWIKAEQAKKYLRPKGTELEMVEAQPLEDCEEDERELNAEKRRQDSASEDEAQRGAKKKRKKKTRKDSLSDEDADPGAAKKKKKKKRKDSLSSEPGAGKKMRKDSLSVEQPTVEEGRNVNKPYCAFDESDGSEESAGPWAEVPTRAEGQTETLGGPAAAAEAAGEHAEGPPAVAPDPEEEFRLEDCHDPRLVKLQRKKKKLERKGKMEDVERIEGKIDKLFAKISDKQYGDSYDEFCKQQDFSSEQISNLKKLKLGLEQVQQLKGKAALDGQTAAACCALLRKKFPKLQGLVPPTSLKLSGKRTKYGCPSAQIFAHDNGYVAAFFSEKGVLDFYDSRDPGSEPTEELKADFKRVFKLGRKYAIHSHFCQKQQYKLQDSLLYSVINVYFAYSQTSVTANDVSVRKLRSHFFEMLANGQLKIKKKKASEERPECNVYK